MLNIMGTLFLYGAFIALFAVTYRLILAYQPVLNWWFRFGLRFSNKWFYNPIWGCELCFAGQVALWVYLLNWLSVNLDRNTPFWRLIYMIVPKIAPQGFNALNGLIFISVTILFTNIAAHLFLKYIKNDN